MPIQDDSTPHSADETLASRVESHRDRKVGKKRKVLANPNEETLQVISKFGEGLSRGIIRRITRQPSGGLRNTALKTLSRLTGISVVRNLRN